MDSCWAPRTYFIKNKQKRELSNTPLACNSKYTVGVSWPCLRLRGNNALWLNYSDRSGLFTHEEVRRREEDRARCVALGCWWGNNAKDREEGQGGEEWWWWGLGGSWWDTKTWLLGCRQPGQLGHRLSEAPFMLLYIKLMGISLKNILSQSDLWTFYSQWVSKKWATVIFKLSPRVLESNKIQ